MKTAPISPKTLKEALEQFDKQSGSFEITAEMLFAFNYEDYNQLFGLEKKEIQHEAYQRIPVLKNENCVAILMLWGVDNTTAIHDHKNYDGHIKVLKGSLTEVSYRENSNFIEYDGAGIAAEGVVFAEEAGGIHSIVNNSDDVSVSLHVYRTSQLNLEGVRLFDTEKRKIAWLSSKASSCSWNLPESAYKKIRKV